MRRIGSLGVTRHHVTADLEAPVSVGASSSLRGAGVSAFDESVLGSIRNSSSLIRASGPSLWRSAGRFSENFHGSDATGFSATVALDWPLRESVGFCAYAGTMQINNTAGRRRARVMGTPTPNYSAELIGGNDYELACHGYPVCFVSSHFTAEMWRTANRRLPACGQNEKPTELQDGKGYAGL